MEPTVIGKPNKHMMDAILASKQFDPKKTLMVGDNLETDILFGQNSGIETLLVMTGASSWIVGLRHFILLIWLLLSYS
jgi:4-nitrophenyl phosphatase